MSEIRNGSYIKLINSYLRYSSNALVEVAMRLINMVKQNVLLLMLSNRIIAITRYGLSIDCTKEYCQSYVIVWS